MLPIYSHFHKLCGTRYLDVPGHSTYRFEVRCARPGLSGSILEHRRWLGMTSPSAWRGLCSVSMRLALKSPDKRDDPNNVALQALTSTGTHVEPTRSRVESKMKRPQDLHISPQQSGVLETHLEALTAGSSSRSPKSSDAPNGIHTL